MILVFLLKKLKMKDNMESLKTWMIIFVCVMALGILIMVIGMIPKMHSSVRYIGLGTITLSFVASCIIGGLTSKAKKELCNCQE